MSGRLFRTGLAVCRFAGRWPRLGQAPLIAYVGLVAGSAWCAARLRGWRSPC